MSPIRPCNPLFAALLLLLLLVLALAGCGSSNGSSNFDPDSGKHPAGWLPAGHKTAALADLESCAQCHGTDYAGGIARVSCTACHIGNQRSIHPAQWGPFANTLHANYVKANGNASCANALCHGANLDGVGGTGPSCTACHMGGVDSAHPAYWKSLAYALHGRYVTSNNNDTAGCANASCHGTNLTGVSGSGPSCTLCHMGGVTAIHPAEWQGDAALHKTRAGFANYDSCRNAACHGAALDGVYLSGPSCYFCHNLP